MSRRPNFVKPLQWHHNEHDGVSNHQLRDCLLNRLSGRRSKKTSKLRVTGLCVGNSPVTGEFPAQKASNAENVSIWWRHHVFDFKPWRIRCGLSSADIKTYIGHCSLLKKLIKAWQIFEDRYRLLVLMVRFPQTGSAMVPFIDPVVPMMGNSGSI